MHVDWSSSLMDWHEPEHTLRLGTGWRLVHKSPAAVLILKTPTVRASSLYFGWGLHEAHSFSGDTVVSENIQLSQVGC